MLLSVSMATAEQIFYVICMLSFPGIHPEDGVRDMIVISDIDENGINTNLQVRYKRDIIYVSFLDSEW